MPRPTPSTCPELRCPSCGRTVELTLDDLRRLNGWPWPTCCGASMQLRVGQRRLSPADGTDPERPALQTPDPSGESSDGH
jgi:hypothetical protein